MFPLPVEKLLAAMPAAAAALGSGVAHAEAFAAAIMTTDTKPKVARAVVDVDGADGADLRRVQGGPG